MKILGLMLTVLLIAGEVCAQAEGWRVVAIPAEEHGYSNFPTVLIATAAQWDKFLKEDSHQDSMAWNDREAFERAVARDGIDFLNESLILIRDTEGSSAHQIRLAPPELRKRTLYVRVVRDMVPGAVTADVAYYCFAVVVSKGAVDRVVIRPDGQNEQVFDIDYK